MSLQTLYQSTYLFDVQEGASPTYMFQQCIKKLDTREWEFPEISPVNVTQLEKELSKHPDKDFVKYLIDGFTCGFDTGLAYLPEQSLECDNLLSAKRQPESTNRTE